MKLEVSGDSLYLRSATGSLRLHITQRKTAGPMQRQVTAEEKKRLSELDAPQSSQSSSQSMIGFSKAGEDKAAAPEPAPQPPPPPPAPSTGTVTVRSDSVSFGSVRGRRLDGIHAGEDRAWSRETQLPRREAGVQGLDERDDDYGGIGADAGCDSGKAIDSP